MTLVRLPDVEAAVVAVLRASHPTAHASDRLGPPYPALKVQQVGGGVATISTSASIQLDAAGAAGSSKAACRELIDTAIAAVLNAAGRTVGDTVIGAVRGTGAPIYLPDPVSGAPRYTATLAVFARSSVPTA